MEVNTLAKDVKCEVDSCIYNEELKCEAKKIMVCNTTDGSEASDVSETGCQTFRNKK